MPQVLNISRPLLKWYDRHRRTLPWRALPGARPDPYHVWLSEIMLQQTTVATVGPYYQKFLMKWPRIEDLATASRDDVMAAWAGLGYYSRARNLHLCAQAVVAEHGGKFPDTEDALIKLPGIGPYTAAAVAAIAFDQRANVVDGNVERVISRVFTIATPLPAGKADIKKAAAPLVPAKRAGDYAQALMDLGATICTPRSPKCGQCPLTALCQAQASGNAEKYPVAGRKKAVPRKQAIIFALEDKEGRLFFRQRPDKGLLGGMLELPSSPWQEDALTLDEAAAFTDLPVKGSWTLLEGEVRHVFTHFELRLRVARGKCLTNRHNKDMAGFWLTPVEAQERALPTLMRKVLRMTGRTG